MAADQIPFVHIDGNGRRNQELVQASWTLNMGGKSATMSVRPFPKQQSGETGVETYRRELANIRDALAAVIDTPGRITIGGV